MPKQGGEIIILTQISSYTLESTVIYTTLFNLHTCFVESERPYFLNIQKKQLKLRAADLPEVYTASKFDPLPTHFPWKSAFYPTHQVQMHSTELDTQEVTDKPTSNKQRQGYVSYSPFGLLCDSFNKTDV